MRVHPISLALRYLKGKRNLPYPLSEEEAVRTLRRFTGRDFGTDAARWGEWLRQNRWVYYAQPGDPRLGEPSS